MKRICPVCKGDGELRKNPGWPDPQTEIFVLCRRCWGTGEIDVPVEVLRDAA